MFRKKFHFGKNKTEIDVDDSILDGSVFKKSSNKKDIDENDLLKKIDHVSELPPAPNFVPEDFKKNDEKNNRFKKKSSNKSNNNDSSDEMDSILGLPPAPSKTVKNSKPPKENNSNNNKSTKKSNNSKSIKKLKSVDLKKSCFKKMDLNKISDEKIKIGDVEKTMENDEKNIEKDESELKKLDTKYSNMLESPIEKKSSQKEPSVNADGNGFLSKIFHKKEKSDLDEKSPLDLVNDKIEQLDQLNLTKKDVENKFVIENSKNISKTIEKIDKLNNSLKTDSFSVIDDSKSNNPNVFVDDDNKLESLESVVKKDQNIAIDLIKDASSDELDFNKEKDSKKTDFESETKLKLQSQINDLKVKYDEKINLLKKSFDEKEDILKLKYNNLKETNLDLKKELNTYKSDLKQKELELKKTDLYVKQRITKLQQDESLLHDKRKNLEETKKLLDIERKKLNSYKEKYQQRFEHLEAAKEKNSNIKVLELTLAKLREQVDEKTNKLESLNQEIRNKNLEYEDKFKNLLEWEDKLSKKERELDERENILLTMQTDMIKERRELDDKEFALYMKQELANISGIDLSNNKITSNFNETAIKEKYESDKKIKSSHILGLISESKTLVDNNQIDEAKLNYNRIVNEFNNSDIEQDEKKKIHMMILNLYGQIYNSSMNKAK
jgi:hypothetical protein